MSGKAATTAKIIIAPVIALSVGAVSFYAFEEMSSEKEIETPFKTVAAESSLGMKWLNDFVETQPFTHAAGGDQNKWAITSSDRTLLPLDSVECAAPQPMPPYVANVKAGKNNTVTVNAALTQPGMSKTIINDYESRADQCDISFSRISDEEIKIGNDTTLLFYGDTIVSVSFGNNANTSNNEHNAIIDETRQRIISSLEESQCKSVETKVSDRKRNIFYTVDNNPEGLFNTEEVKTSVETDNLPTMVDVELELVNYPNLIKPEAPYPDGFPEVPESVNRPEIPPLPQVSNDAYAKDVTYEVPDFEGAGCGWEWAIGQQSPEYNVEAMEEEQNRVISDALNEVNETASNYVNTYLSVLSKRVLKQNEIVHWNEYVNDLNNVHNRWMELENQRDAIEPSYDQYVYNHNNWSTFNDRKEIAQDLYDRMLEKCEELDEAYIEWVEDDEESLETSPEPIVCDEVYRPSILSQERGNEPVFVLPEGVTIPESWTKPGENLNATINAERSAAESQYNSFINRLESLEQENREEWEAAREAEQEAEETTTPTTTTTPATPTNEPEPEREPEPLDDLLDLIT